MASKELLAITQCVEQHQARSFRHNSLIVCSVLAICGSIAPIAQGPALTVAALWLLFAGLPFLRGAPKETSHKRIFLRLLFVACLFLVGRERSLSAIVSFQESYFQTLTQIQKPSRCAGIAKVITSPTLRSRKTPEGRNERVTLWTGRIDFLDCEGTQLTGSRVLRLYGGPHDLARGDEVEIIAKLAPVRLFRNASLPNPWPGAARRRALLSGSAVLAERVKSGESWKTLVDNLRFHVRARIVETYSPLTAPMGRALVLGENDLGDDDAEAFRNSGLLHLLAVSGTHLVIAVFALVQGLRALLVRVGPLARRFDVARVSSFLGAILSILYADFSGGSGSAWRAAFMLCIVCGGRALGLRINGASALGSSLLIGIAVDPLAGSDFSFLLSALATSGLIGIGQPLANILNRGVLAHAPLRQLTISLVATISSTLPCAPVLSMMDGDMTFAALFANVVAGPLGEVIALPACLLHGAVSFFPALESGLALLGSGALYAVRAVALWSASVQEAVFAVPFPSPWDITRLIAVIFCIRELMPLVRNGLGKLFVVLFVWRSAQRKVALSWGMAALLVSGLALHFLTRTYPAKTELELTPASGAHRLSITALDVGQGDALFIDFPDGSTGLVDAGGFATGIPDTGERVILPYLRSRKLKKIDLVVLSHPHPDHMNGLFSLFKAIKVSQFWVPGAGVPKKGQLARLLALARKQGTRIVFSDELCARTSKQKGGFATGGAQIEVLAPCFAQTPPFHANDASLVLRITHQQRAVLFTGDIEERAEALLLKESPHLLAADLLKVAHHGSATSSSPAFVDAVKPKYAFISCGVRNRFNHPRPTTLRTLRTKADGTPRSINIMRTDRLGSITWSTDGNDQVVRSFSKKPPPNPQYFPPQTWHHEFSALVPPLSPPL